MSGEVAITFVKEIGTAKMLPGGARWSMHDSSPHPGKESSLLFSCPCGCGSLKITHVIKIDKNPVWSWNGSRERPTLTPRILSTTCGWCGYLTDGVFVRWAR